MIDLLRLSPEFVLDLNSFVEAGQGNIEGDLISSRQLKFSGRVYLYIEPALSESELAALMKLAESLNLSVIIRDSQYLKRRRQCEKVINEFLAEYHQLHDIYVSAASYIQEYLEELLGKGKVLAWVTARAKNPERLKAKLWKRALPVESGKQYMQVADIYDDIVDLAGVRVNLYFPGDRDRVGKIIAGEFKLSEPPRQYTGGKSPPSYARRFSGYWATHYRIEIDPRKILPAATPWPGKGNLRAEIQVSSIIMQAWAEVEHDLQYKELEGQLLPEEQKLLDQLNGLVLTGELLLEQLQDAGNKRRASIKAMQERWSGRSSAN